MKIDTDKLFMKIASWVVKFALRKMLGRINATSDHLNGVISCRINEIQIEEHGRFDKVEDTLDIEEVLQDTQIVMMKEIHEHMNRARDVLEHLYTVRQEYEGVKHVR